jgi:hypothetical protein
VLTSIVPGDRNGDLAMRAYLAVVATIISLLCAYVALLPLLA